MTLGNNKGCETLIKYCNLKRKLASKCQTWCHQHCRDILTQEENLLMMCGKKTRYHDVVHKEIRSIADV